jgi:hypothetical protein
VSDYYGRRERAGHGVWPVLLAVVLAAAVITTTVAAVVLTRDDSGGSAAPDAAGPSGGVVNSPMTVVGERSVVPDACTVIRESLASELVPDADRTNLRSPDTTDRHTECAWARYGANGSRQLSVELRALQAPNSASSATVAARRTFQTEWRADSAGKGLLPTQRVVARKVIVDLGDEAYVTYSSDRVQLLGEAIVSVRVVNVLVTIHYAGGDVRGGAKGAPLPKDPAMAGATTAARQAVSALTAAQ